jgi:hypothetical protein
MAEKRNFSIWNMHLLLTDHNILVSTTFTSAATRTYLPNVGTPVSSSGAKLCGFFPHGPDGGTAPEFSASNPNMGLTTSKIGVAHHKFLSIGRIRDDRTQQHCADS